MTICGLKFAITIVAVTAATTLAATAQQAVEIKGQSSKPKINQVVSGHLTELNGKYRLRISEATFEPGGFVGPHHHAGPGIRCITSGELTYTSSDGKNTVYKPGDCFYESGDVTHTAKNAADKPTVLLNFEIVPTSLSGPSIMPVPAAR